jgi:hypothetical protein
VDTMTALEEVFYGCYEQNIKNVKIEGNSLFYKKDINIEFFAVPLSQFGRPIEIPKTQITIDFAKELSVGNYELLYATSYNFSGAQIKRVYIPQGESRLVFTIPETGWNTLRLDFPSVMDEYEIVEINGSDGKTNFTLQSANMVETFENADVLNIKVKDPLDPYITFILE